jgi:hypothetical protein
VGTLGNRRAGPLPTLRFPRDRPGLPADALGRSDPGPRPEAPVPPGQRRTSCALLPLRALGLYPVLPLRHRFFQRRHRHPPAVPLPSDGGRGGDRSQAVLGHPGQSRRGDARLHRHGPPHLGTRGSRGRSPHHSGRGDLRTAVGRGGRLLHARLPFPGAGPRRLADHYLRHAHRGPGLPSLRSSRPRPVPVADRGPRARPLGGSPHCGDDPGHPGGLRALFAGDPRPHRDRGRGGRDPGAHRGRGGRLRLPGRGPYAGPVRGRRGDPSGRLVALREPAGPEGPRTRRGRPGRAPAPRTGGESARGFMSRSNGRPGRPPRKRSRSGPPRPRGPAGRPRRCERASPG